MCSEKSPETVAQALKTAETILCLLSPPEIPISAQKSNFEAKIEIFRPEFVLDFVGIRVKFRGGRDGKFLEVF